MLITVDKDSVRLNVERRNSIVNEFIKSRDEYLTEMRNNMLESFGSDVYMACHKGVIGKLVDSVYEEIPSKYHGLIQQSSAFSIVSKDQHLHWQSPFPVPYVDTILRIEEIKSKVQRERLEAKFDNIYELLEEEENNLNMLTDYIESDLLQRHKTVGGATKEFPALENFISLDVVQKPDYTKLSEYVTERMMKIPN